MAERKSSKRDLIDTGKDKRFDEEADVGRSIAQDRKKHAKNVVESGQGDRGDQKRRP